MSNFQALQRVIPNDSPARPHYDYLQRARCDLEITEARFSNVKARAGMLWGALDALHDAGEIDPDLWDDLCHEMSILTEWCVIQRDEGEGWGLYERVISFDESGWDVVTDDDLACASFASEEEARDHIADLTT